MSLGVNRVSHKHLKGKRLLGQISEAEVLGH